MIYSRKDKSVIVSKSFKFIEFLLLINAALMVIGFLFDLEIFKSYVKSSRFGYDGIFNKVNEVSNIYSIYLVYLYQCVFITKTRHWGFFMVMVLICLLLGTKTILLLYCLLFVYHFFFVVKSSKPLKITILVLVFGFISFFEKIIICLFDLFPFWDHLQEKYGLLTLLFSKRDILFYNTMTYINSNWNEINYFIGGGFYSKSFAISQMDGPDLFLFFGIVGTFIYLYIFSIIFLKKNNTVLNGLILIVLICGFFGGGLLNSGMSMILLFLVSTVLNEKYNFKLNS